MFSTITFFGVVSALFSELKDTIKIVLIILMGELGRWLIGGGKFREKCGDLIICLLIFFLVKPHIVSLPEIYGVKISAGAIAIVISLLGTHGVSVILLFFLKKKTGFEVSDK